VPPNFEEEISPIEKNMLKIAIEKLNFVSRNGRGESLGEDEMTVFRFWLGKGRVKAIESARFGEIYEFNE
jgi:hypothetical protein